MRAAGAATVIAGTENSRVGWFFESDKDDKSTDSSSSSSKGNDEARFEQYVAALNAAGVVPNVTGLYSAHQMGSCRMAAKAADGPVRPSGETYECRGLFVADASTFPTSVGCVAVLVCSLLPL
jgi:hypothetical protein